jgi:hypothetical protein
VDSPYILLVPTAAYSFTVALNTRTACYVSTVKSRDGASVYQFINFVLKFAAETQAEYFILMCGVPQTGEITQSNKAQKNEVGQFAFRLS